MRRISVKNAEPGMVLGEPVYDSYGKLLLDGNSALAEYSLKALVSNGVRELIIEDSRFADVSVQPLIAPGVEAEAVQTLTRLLTRCRGQAVIDKWLLAELEKPIYAMVREMFPLRSGEVNSTGCSSPQEFVYVRPVKVAGLSMLIGVKAGSGVVDVANLGLAAALMDIGYTALSSGLAERAGLFTDRECQETMKHPECGAAILGRCGRYGDVVVKAVLQHHERWDGSGYPSGLKGASICQSARILAIADSYYELVSEMPNRRAYPPNEAVEFIMAYSGELFDPALVQILARHVPLYPTGVAVKLNTGEVGVVSDSNRGYIGRPRVRVCLDKVAQPLETPYEIDLSQAQYRDRMVANVIDY